MNDRVHQDNGDVVFNPVMNQWMPSKKELVAEAGLLVALAVLQSIYSIISKWPIPIVILVVLTTLLLGAGLLAVYEYFRRPARRRVLQGKDLIDTIDRWLGDNGYTRGPLAIQGYSYGLTVAGFDCTMWILKEENRNSLVIGSSRTEGTVQPSILEQLGVHKWADVQYDLALELSRFGVGYSITQAPLTVTYWDNLVVDETLSEARLLAVVVDIQRVDKLVNLIVSKETVSVRLSQPTSPRFEDFQRSMSPT